jgi:hypothetical protein
MRAERRIEEPRTVLRGGGAPHAAHHRGPGEGSESPERGRPLRLTLAARAVAATPPANFDLMEVDRALDELSQPDERLGRLVELRFFGRLTSQEAAQALGISLSTANREWAHAKTWLFRRLKPTPVGRELPRLLTRLLCPEVAVRRFPALFRVVSRRIRHEMRACEPDGAFFAPMEIREA